MFLLRSVTRLIKGIERKRILEERRRQVLKLQKNPYSQREYMEEGDYRYVKVYDSTYKELIKTNNNRNKYYRVIYNPDDDNYVL